MNPNLIKKEDLTKLRKPIKNKWRVANKIETQSGLYVNMVAYIDARDVQERLDDVLGAQNWQIEYYNVKNTLFCRIGIKIGDEWIWKSDAGSPTKIEQEKGEASDAFKRAAVQWGINRVSYLFPTIRLKAKLYGKQAYPVDDKGNFLKGENLYKVCDEKAKVEEFDMAFESLIAEEDDTSDSLKSNVLKNDR